jgi:hypothetical protein
MATLTKTGTVNKDRTNWREFWSAFFGKVAENIMDMIVTVATVGVTLAYLATTQPLAFFEYAGFIIWIFFCLLALRIVHDFDDSYTNDELGQRLETILDITKDLYRATSNDNAHLTDDELEQRIHS